jgi:hypothetical protein
MEGAVVYMICTVLSWIVDIIRRARAAEISHPKAQPRHRES